MTRLISTIGGAQEKIDRKQYVLGKHACQSTHSSLALAELASRTDHLTAPEEILLIKTSDQDIDHEWFRERGEQVSVSQKIFQSRMSGDDVRTIVRDVLELFEGPTGIVDLTGCDPELTAMICGYVSARQPSGKTSEGPSVYAGRPEQNPDVIRFRNLEPAIKLPGWGIAHDNFRTFHEGGLLSNLLNELHNDSYREEDLPESRRLQQLAHMLSGSTRNLNTALPIEAGLTGHPKDDSFWQEVREDADQLIPVLNRIVPDVRDYFQEFNCTKNTSEKPDVPLTENELERQHKCAKRLVSSGKILPAFLLARELLVNGALLGTSASVPGEEWLDADRRSKAGAPFYLLDHWNQYEELRERPSKQQRRLSTVWGAVKDRRNKLAHAGFSKDAIRYDRLQRSLEEKLQDIKSLTMNERSLLENPLDFPFDGRLVLLATDGRSPDKMKQVIRSTCHQQDYVSTVILLIPDSETPDSYRAHVNNVINPKETTVDFWEIPGGENRFDHWQHLWEQHRRTLLCNQTVTLSVSNGSPATNHTIRQLFTRISQFGIPTKLVTLEEEGAHSERFRITTIESHWSS